MDLSRRTIFRSIPAAAGILRDLRAEDEFGFPQRRPSRALIPQPANGAVATINPPGFAWWRAGNADSYRLIIRDTGGKSLYERSGIRNPVHLPDRTLPPGTFTWDVEACDASGSTRARRGSWSFSVAPDLPELPWLAPQALLRRVPDRHPRYIFVGENIAALRRSLQSTRRAAWEQLKAKAERALTLGPPPRPRYDLLEGRPRQRMAYQEYYWTFSRHVGSGMTPLALAYLFSGNERYGLAAKKILLEIETWGLEGTMSVLSPFGDEPGLQMGQHGHRAYDWLYDLLDESERERVRRMCCERARQLLQRLLKHDYLARPEDSHDGRLLAFLCEYAVVLKGEAPDAAEWLDYSLQGLTTSYPYWGDSDGGWAEGLSFAADYNTLSTPPIEALRAATGFDLYKRPAFGSVRRFFLYCAAPRGEIEPFGDRADYGDIGLQAAALMSHYGRCFRDPAALWWAVESTKGAVEKDMHRTALSQDAVIPMLTDADIAPAPPANSPGVAVFRGVGWAALHSALDEPDRDTFFLFKSSPFGSVSHSHADQNSFCVLKGGRALAIASGYYGPTYGAPHHAEWTRQTKANNCVLVNGEGQLVRSENATGKIVRFEGGKAFTYVCGDAAAAYGGKMTAFLRHVLFLRPGVFLLLDELAAPRPSKFQWLLHAFDKMEVNEAARTVTSSRYGHSLTVRLDGTAGLALEQNNRFDTPYNYGMPPDYQEERPDQWHFTATTVRAASQTRIAAAMVVRSEGEAFETEWKSHPGWAGIALRNAGGEGELWVQVSPGAPGSKGIPRTTLLTAIWKPAHREPEQFSIQQ